MEKKSSMLTPAYRHGLEIYKEMRLATYRVDALKRVGCSLHLCATSEEEGDDITAYYRFKMIQVKILWPLSFRLRYASPFTFSGKRLDFRGCNCIHATVSTLQRRLHGG